MLRRRPIRDWTVQAHLVKRRRHHASHTKDPAGVRHRTRDRIKFRLWSSAQWSGPGPGAVPPL